MKHERRLRPTAARRAWCQIAPATATSAPNARLRLLAHLPASAPFPPACSPPIVHGRMSAVSAGIPTRNVPPSKS